MLEWYALLGKLNNFLSPYLTGLAREFNIPLLTALLLGLLGSTAPCQLTTNFSALGLITQKVDDNRQAMLSTLSFTLGKVLVYTFLGSLTILLGIKLNQQAIPVIQTVRKLLGPLMLLIGLFMLGLIKTRFGFLLFLEEKLYRYTPKGPFSREFFLGVLYSLAFCPTLFWLFFGMVIPLGISTPGGIVLPGVFALGTAIPLITLALLLTYGIGKAKHYLTNLQKLNLWLQKGAGIIFILAGINEIVVYWLI